jgi:starch synthase
MRIVFVVSEMVPFAKTGGLADVCGTLPIELERAGHDVSVIMPAYRCVGAQGRPFNDRFRVTTVGKDLKVYFLKNPKFYDRAYIYGDAHGDYADSLERFAYLCHEAFHLMKELGKPVDIVHAHDWQTALVPVILKEKYADDPFFAGTRSVLTIHNLAYQGVFPKEDIHKTGLDGKLFDPKALEFYEKVNLLKGGIVFADLITTVSPQYAKEMQTKELGFGLEGVVKENKSRLVGILNGLDYKMWDPEKDPLLAPQYSSKDWLIKRIHKEKLQHVYGLPVFSDVPVFGFVGRLCYQKGLDLVEAAFENLTQRPVQFAFIGVGEDKYQKLLVKLAKKYPQQCGVVIRYDESLAHTVYAGSDFFMMPSVYEPCGLTQMISLRYGTIPVASAVGGLLDTVVDYSSNKKQGNGFLMSSYSVSGLLEVIDRASGVFHEKQRFHDLVIHAMSARWTWDASVKHYIDCYQHCLQGSK